MRWLIRIVLGLVVLAVVFVASVFAASEAGDEIVVLETLDAEGAAVETRLWVVEHDGAAWLRAGVPENGWLVRLEQKPEVRVTRAGQTGDFRAVPVREPAVRDRVHELMREKYGLSDWWVSQIRDGTLSVPVRLEPLGS